MEQIFTGEFQNHKPTYMHKQSKDRAFCFPCCPPPEILSRLWSSTRDSRPNSLAGHLHPDEHRGASAAGICCLSAALSREGLSPRAPQAQCSTKVLPKAAGGNNAAISLYLAFALGSFMTYSSPPMTTAASFQSLAP